LELCRKQYGRCDYAYFIYCAALSVTRALGASSARGKKSSHVRGNRHRFESPFLRHCIVAASFIAFLLLTVYGEVFQGEVINSADVGTSAYRPCNTGQSRHEVMFFLSEDGLWLTRFH
jgi:hypothetical protein